MKYSSGKSLLLDLPYLNPVDDLNKQLFREISDISKFGEQVIKLLNVEFSTSSSGKRPTCSSSAGECDENKAKRPRSDNNSPIASAQPYQLSSPHVLSITVSESTNVSGSVPSASSGSNHGQFTTSDDGDETVVESSQQCYVISPRKLIE